MDEGLVRSEYARLGTERFVSFYLVDGTPEIFSSNRTEYNEWRVRIANLVELDPGDVFLVGSAALGCSLNPNKTLFRPFCDESDLDVAVISSFHFDLAWRTFRSLNRADARTKEQDAAISRHKKKLVFDGCIATESCGNLLPFGENWAQASITASGIPPAEGRKVSFRIYRDIASLRDYHIRNLRSLMQ